MSLEIEGSKFGSASAPDLQTPQTLLKGNRHAAATQAGFGGSGVYNTADAFDGMHRKEISLDLYRRILANMLITYENTYPPVAAATKNIGNITMTVGDFWRTKTRVYDALLIRELMSRYGRGNLGFFWLVAEPLILTFGVIIMWSIMYGARKHGVIIVPFVLTGYSMLTLWRHLLSRGMTAIAGSSDLLYHREIRVYDVFIVHNILEVFGILIAFFVAYVPLVLLGYAPPVDDYLILLGAWFLMSFFAYGIGMIIASLSVLFDVIEKFIAPLMYVTLPLTGAFYMLNWLSRDLQEFLSWIPMVNAMEMFRGGYLGPSVRAMWDASYLLICGIISNCVGVTLMRIAVARREF